MRKRKVLGALNIDVDLVNHAHKPSDKDFRMGDSTYRHDGFSIGCDYLRLEGRTVTRGELIASSLSVNELIGQGAFSQVHRGTWRRKNETIEVAVRENELEQSFFSSSCRRC